ncbi:MAG: hypothetical protein ACW96S_05310 [Promethearchaeota archaeon]|jgi:hypothetical protein
MSLSITSRKRITIENEEISDEKFPDISKFIIPFNVVFNIFNPPDIYDGDEVIPFKEKDPEFQEILIHEFISRD